MLRVTMGTSGPRYLRPMPCSLFKEKGIFNPEVAEAFRREILSKGGHEHPMTLYVNFRGHKPETKALIEKMGLEKSSEK